MKKLFILLSILILAGCKTGYKIDEDLLTYTDVDEAIEEYKRVFALAIEEKDSQLCKQLPVKATYGGHVDSSIFLVHTMFETRQQDRCLFEYAKTYKDASACYPSCLKDLAIHFNDTSFCDVPESEIKEECLKGFEEWQEFSKELELLRSEIIM